ncbi:hypothetical protein ES703_36369 [subsurface metagenome]
MGLSFSPRRALSPSKIPNGSLLTASRPVIISESSLPSSSHSNISSSPPSSPLLTKVFSLKYRLVSAFSSPSITAVAGFQLPREFSHLAVSFSVVSSPNFSIATCERLSFSLSVMSSPGNSTIIRSLPCFCISGSVTPSGLIRFSRIATAPSIALSSCPGSIEDMSAW